MANKKIKPVWLDVGKNLDVPCPHVSGKIMIKALRLPQGVKPKYLLKKQESLKKSTGSTEPSAVSAASRERPSPSK